MSEINLNSEAPHDDNDESRKEALDQLKQLYESALHEAATRVPKTNFKLSIGAFLSNHLQYWPLYTILIALYAYLYHRYYYFAFGISILDFMSYSDMVFRIIPTSVIFLACFACGLIAFNAILESDKFRNRILRLITLAVATILQIFSLLATMAFHLGFLLSAAGYVFVFIGSGLTFFGILVIRLTGGMAEKHTDFWKVSSIFFGLLSFYTMSFSIGLVEAKALLEDKRVRAGYNFKYGDKKFSTNDTFFYVGNTEKYFFFYNTTEKASRVFKIEDTDSLVVKYFTFLSIKH